MDEIPTYDEMAEVFNSLMSLSERYEMLYGSPRPTINKVLRFWGKLLRKWDWWIYIRAHKSLCRLCEAEPAYGYLMELQIQHWNAREKLPDSLKRSTELFHASLVDSQHNARAMTHGANENENE